VGALWRVQAADAWMVPFQADGTDATLLVP
jgi:hypothetical protein